MVLCESRWTWTDVLWSAYLRKYEGAAEWLQRQMEKEQKQRETFRDWDGLPEKEHDRNEKYTEETSIILLVQEQGDSQWQQQTWIWWKTLFLLRKISCITSLWDSFTRAGRVLRRTEKKCLGVLYVCSRNHSQTKRKKNYLKEWSYKPLLFSGLDW